MSTQTERPPEQSSPLTNHQIAAHLEELADLLEAQGANQYRVRAYRTAAQNLRDLPRPVHEILATDGVAGLIELPGIGQSLAPLSKGSARTAGCLSWIACGARPGRSAFS